MDFRHGFELWRHLGFTSRGEHISLEALTAIHYVHRLVAYVVVAGPRLVGMAARAVASLRRQARWIAVLIAAQMVTGISNVLFGWPLLVAVAHTAGAAALLVVLTWALSESRRAVGATHMARHGARRLFYEHGRSGRALQRARPSRVRQFYALTKPRVIQLIVFCALIGMALAVPGMPTLADLRLGPAGQRGHLAGRELRRRLQLPRRKGHRREDEAHVLAADRQGRVAGLGDAAVRAAFFARPVRGCCMSGSIRSRCG